MYPEPLRRVVVYPYLLTGTYSQLPIYLIGNTVGLIHKKVVTLTVLSVLLIFVALKFYNRTVLALQIMSAFVHIKVAPQPFRTS